MGWQATKKIIACVAMSAALLAGGVAWGQNAGLDEVYDPAGEATRLLGAEYKDEAAGFRLTVPVGSRIIQRANLELVSFVVDGKQWSGNLQLAITGKDMTVEEFLKTAAADLTKTFRAVQIRKSELINFQGKKAGNLTTTVEALVDTSVPGGPKTEPQRLLLHRQLLVVQLSGNQFQVLAFNAPLKDRDNAEKTWTAMLERYEILDRAKVAERRAKAVAAGKEWFKERAADELKEKLIREPQLFRVSIDNSDVGYVRFDEFEDKRDGVKGVIVAMNSRTFPPNNSVVMAQTETFWAYKDPQKDMPHYSSWTSGLKNVVFRPMVAGGPEFQHVGWNSELGILQRKVQQGLKEVVGKGGRPEQIVAAKRDEGYWLNVTLSEKEVSRDYRDNRPAWEITAEQPAPLPKLLEYTWMRLVDLKKPSSMAFVVYNPGTRKLGLRTLSVVGPAAISLDGKRVDCIKLTDELDPGTTTIWVDDKGKMLMMRSSDQTVLTPTTELRMTQLWGKRLEKINTTPMAKETIIDLTKQQPGSTGGVPSLPK